MIERVEEPEAIATEWAALWERVPGAAVFQRPEWLLAWLRAFPAPGACVLARRSGARLVGVAPFVRYVEDDRRVVGLLGGGVSDCLDVLVEPGVAVAPFLEALDDHDVLDLRGLRDGSPLLAGGCEPDGVCPVLDLAAPAPASPRLRDNLAYARRRAGPLRVRRVPADETTEALDALARLHGQRWQRRGEPGMLADDVVRAFHAAAAPPLVARGLARLYTLHVGDRLAAVHYGLRAPVAYYLGGFDPELARLSPGALLLASVIDEARAEGVPTFDFLRGAEPYKYAWGAVDRPLWRRRVDYQRPGRRRARPAA